MPNYLMKKASQLPEYEGTTGNLMVLAVDVENGQTVQANLAAVFQTFAGLKDPRIKEMTASNLVEGAMLFYDKAEECYCVVAPEAVAAVLADYNTHRYETNFDTYVGTFEGYAHFIANDDAVSENALFSDDVAATSCFYRIEIDNTQAGSITFSATSGNGSIASNTVSWDADTSMTDIVALFTALNATYITFGALTDGTGVGVEIGGYGANTLTATATSNCTVIDCSGLAFYASENPLVEVGDTYIPTAAYTYIAKGTHHNWRGAAAATCLPSKNLIGASSSCIANDGFDYSYRVGLNYAKFLSWATTNGDDTFYDDGEGGTDNSVGHVMKKTRFDTDVTAKVGLDPDEEGISATEKEKRTMAGYYNHLYNDQDGEYAELRQEYQAKYGQMTSLYDAYIMSHMMAVDAASGITNAMRNNGLNQTVVKGDAMNVNYNYKIIPAYPPEYNAQQYCLTASEGFKAGSYYHPEPGDQGLMFRDDIMPLINANITAAGEGTALTNSMYRGCTADSNALYSWCFHGGNGCFDYNYRYGGGFRCRPALALQIPA